MGYLYKLKPEIVKFLINKKWNYPEISCRKLSSEVSERFDFKLSKSSVNLILKREGISSPAGRRSRQIIDFEKPLDHGGAFLLKGADSLLGITRTASEIVYKLIPSSSIRVELREIETMIQGFIIFKSLYDTTIDTAVCYNNNEIWAIVGRRPTKAGYNRIINMINNSQLFVEQLVIELRQRLKPISGFRFILSNRSSFFVDSQFHSVWPTPIVNNKFITTFYSANSYVNRFIENKAIISLFNIQGTSILSSEIQDFIVSLNSEDRSKQLTHIELLDLDKNVVERKVILTSETRLFLLGFWPWQLDMMQEFERKPAKNKFNFSQLGLEYYYQIEEVLLTQPLITQKVMLTALLLKASPLGAAKIGILTNIPKEILLNRLTIKELYHWILPEERYKRFTNSINNPSAKDLISPLLDELNSEGIQDYSLDRVFGMLSRIVFRFFQLRFIPEECQSWNALKIKDIFLRQKAKIERGSKFIVHNTINSNRLCKEDYLRYICQQLNDLAIEGEQGRVLWFKYQMNPAAFLRKQEAG